jgi:hypothetical protein
MNNDLINGLFEGIGGILNTITIYRVVKDKGIKGVSTIPTIFFILWGIWNLYYYPSLNQPYSFIGGILIVITNIIWVALVIKYYIQNKKQQ